MKRFASAEPRISTRSLLHLADFYFYSVHSDDLLSRHVCLVPRESEAMLVLLLDDLITLDTHGVQVHVHSHGSWFDCQGSIRMKMWIIISGMLQT